MLRVPTDGMSDKLPVRMADMKNVCLRNVV